MLPIVVALVNERTESMTTVCRKTNGEHRYSSNIFVTANVVYRFSQTSKIMYMSLTENRHDEQPYRIHLLHCHKDTNVNMR